MTLTLRLLLFAALAGAGFFLGTRFPPDTLAAGNTAPKLDADTVPLNASANDAESKPSDEGTRRDPRTGATFLESLDRLKELSQKGNSQMHLIEGQRLGAVPLEIERIFALANREEMLEYFANEGTAPPNPVVLTLAYARLATLSIEDAKAVWADEFKRTGKGMGIDGLVRIWAIEDAAAAEVWVDQMKPGKTRDLALAALLDGAMESHPDLVERRFTDVKGMMESIGLISRFTATLAPPDFAPLADRILKVKDGNWLYQNQLVTLLEEWGKQDGAAMLKWLTERPSGSLQSHVLSRVAESRAAPDPAAFAREIGPSLESNEALAEMAGRAWMKWLENGDDDKGAMEWFQVHGAHLQLSNSGWYSGRLSTESAVRVLGQIATLPEGGVRKQLGRSILNTLSQSDPESALEYARELLPPGQDTDWFIASTLSNLSRNGQPEEALEWAMQNLATGTGQNDAVRLVMSSWAQSNPREAAKTAGGLPEKLRDQALSGIAYEWAGKAPDQAVDFLASSSAPETHAGFARNVFWSLGYNKGGEAYLDSALNLPHEAMRREAIRGLFGGWSSANAETSAAALQKLERGPLRDVAISEFADQVGALDREAAFVWSLEIQDPAKQREIAMREGRQWLNSDRATAARWIESSERISAEMRAELLGPAK